MIIAFVNLDQCKTSAIAHTTYGIYFTNNREKSPDAHIKNMKRVQGTLDQKSVSVKLDTHKIFATNHTLVATPSIPQTLYYMIILYPVQIVVHYKPNSTILLKVSTQHHQSSLVAHAVVSFRNHTSQSVST